MSYVMIFMVVSVCGAAKMSVCKAVNINLLRSADGYFKCSTRPMDFYSLVVCLDI